jgi:hypothetical protein
MQQALFEEVKNQLNITWSDEATDRKINSIIARAIGVINGYAGQVLDINVDENINGDAQLLIDCCRYIYNDCFEDFEKNYHSQLFALRARCQIEEMSGGSV